MTILIGLLFAAVPAFAIAVFISLFDFYLSLIVFICVFGFGISVLFDSHENRKKL